MSKDIYDWTEEDILGFVRNNVPESATLDFKACDALRRVDKKKDWRKEFAKDVSAFANSGGGILIYGIIENRDTHEAESLDDGFEPSDVNIETLEQIANSHIQRRIDGIKYKSISLTGDRQGRVLYVLDLPESAKAPHMANHRYYKRYNFESVYMDEHEVRDRYDRERHPGKDIVEAWRDDVINPLLATVEAEYSILQRPTWTWKHYDENFGGLSAIGKQAGYSGNKEDFVTRHSEIESLLEEHDSKLDSLNTAGKKLFEAFANGGVKELFLRVTSDFALLSLASENSSLFGAKSAEEIRTELFGRDERDREPPNYFVEWAMNGRAETNVPPLSAFWKKNEKQFYDHLKRCWDYPDVFQARTDLKELIAKLIATLKAVRKELSERHNIPVEALQRTTEYPHYNQSGLGW